jgi:hypothetical protein
VLTRFSTAFEKSGRVPDFSCHLEGALTESHYRRTGGAGRT